MDLLGLKDVKVVSCTDLGVSYLIEADYRMVQIVCPKCDDNDIYLHGGRHVDYTDTQLHGKPVIVRLVRRRCRCRKCGKTFLLDSPEMDEDFRMTIRCAEWIEQQATQRTFTQVAADMAIDESVVRDVFRRYSGRHIAELDIKAGRVLGIDEVYINSEHRCIFTNIEDRTVIDLLKARTRPVVIPYLKGLKNLGAVEVVCMDMWEPYKLAVGEVIPQAKVVVDKFHLLKEASKCMNTVRLHYQRQMKGHGMDVFHNRYLFNRRNASLTDEQRKKLEAWKVVCPDLIAAYELKEKLFDMYLAETKADAKNVYEGWVNSLPLFIHKAFKPPMTTIGNWEPEIFNYFDARFTNAYTECMNGILKISNRSGRGYSFEVARFKLLFAYNAQRVHGSTARSLLATLKRLKLDVPTNGEVTVPIPG